MRKVAVMLMMLVFASIFAQTEWELVYHSTKIPTLEKELGEMLAAGYEPVGIELVQDGVKRSVLTMYEKVEEPSIQSVKIIEIFDLNTLKETLTKETMNGYLPMDLTYFTQSIIVLLVKYEDSPITQWAFDAAEASYEDIGKSLENFTNNSHEWIPVGIMGHEEFQKYLLMYLKVPGYELQDYNVYTFDGLENFQQGVNQLYEEGWAMCGFSIYGNEWDVVVVKGTFVENENSSGTSDLQIVAQNVANMIASAMSSYLDSHKSELKRLLHLSCGYGESLNIGGSNFIELPSDYNCKIDVKDVIVSHRSGVSAKAQWLNVNKLTWEGNWGDGSLFITNANDQSFNFKFQVCNSRGHTGEIENGIAYFDSNNNGIAVFYDDTYPDYSIVFSLKDNQILVNEVNPKTRVQNLNSPYCGAGISFTGTYTR